MTDLPINKPKTFEDFRILTHHIVQLAMRGLMRVDFLDEVSKVLMEFSGCDSVEIWLSERGRYYFSEITRSKSPQFHFEIVPTVEENGQIIPKVREHHLPERLCRDVILKRVDPYTPFITPRGGFWTGDAKSAFVQIAKKLGIENSRRFIHIGDFLSVAVIPISVEEEGIGLMELKSESPDFFSEKNIEFYESVVQTLGMALVHRRTQVERRERIKELTCLYGIAKLVENTDLSLSKVLQGIVELLPPAWLHPEVASARIVLDGKSYLSARFQEGHSRQEANIVSDDETRGFVEVNYSENKPELDEGPFLREERSLIDAVAKEISIIIEHKQNVEEREKLQEQLRHADRLATIGQLSAGIAHELNEPIGSILGFAKLIQKYPSLPIQVHQDTEKILKASLHAREVIRKLMLFARQMPPQKTKVNLNQIVDEGLYFLESRCAKEGINVKRILFDGLPAIYADPAQMTQVLVNVVVNAIQAMPEGGELKIQTMATKKFVSLVVIDSGVGMEEKIKEKIFLPFFTTKDIREGTGLGLSVVHGIVTSHGGSILLDSHVGKGTRFEIKLPVAG